MIRALLIVAVLAGIIGVSVKAYEHLWPNTHEERARVRIGSETFELEIASTPSQRTQGLMQRTDLAPCGGMVFLFPRTQPMAFWMHNTPTPLWMAFVTDAGHITRLIPRAVPNNDATLDSFEPTSRVIEIAADCPRLAALSKNDHVAITYPESVSIR